MTDEVKEAIQQLRLMIENAECDIRSKEADMESASPLVKLVLSGTYIEQQKLFIKNLKTVLRTLEGEQDERN